MIVRLGYIDEVVAKIVDDLNLGDKDIPESLIVEWIYNGLKRIGAYDQFEKKTCRVKIVDYRGDLPNDFYRVDAAKFSEPHKVGHSTITVGFKTGSIELSYLAMPVDERGYPMVPDDTTFHEALLWLVASKLAMRDELPNKKLSFEFCNTKWERLMLAARTEAQMGDIQFIQRRSNDFRKMVFSLNPLLNGGSVGKQEMLDRD